MVKFSIKELLKRAWKQTLDNVWFVLPILLIAYAVGVVWPDSVLGSVVSFIMSFVLASVFLRISRGEKVSWNNMFEGLTPKLFLQFFLLSLISSIFIFAGLLLLIVPGVIVMIMMIFANYALMDRRGKAIEHDAFWRSIKESAALAKGSKMRIFVFLLVIIGINILGILAFGIGILITAPVSALAVAMLYDTFKRAKEHHHSNTETVPASIE